MPIRNSILLLLLLSLAAATSLCGQSRKPAFNRYAEGKFVYERNCIVCHGAQGDGLGELGVKLQPRPRSFREGIFKFRSTPAGALPTDADLVRTIRGGLSGTDMGMFTHLRDNEVRAVIEYLKSFSRRWRKVENYARPMELPAPPTWLDETDSLHEHAKAGAPLYQNTCASCHGTQADGNGPAAAELKVIWNLPARPSDLRQPHLRCGPAPADIYRVLATGLNGTPMVSFETSLTPEQRWDIIAYILTLRLPEKRTLGAAPESSLRLQDPTAP